MPAHKTHGMSKGKGRRMSKLYQTWAEIKQRCLNPKSCNYPNYGARGVTVCDRWLTFENFAADMGEPPTPKHSIDRIDNSKGYEPGNCRWATVKEQANNRRSNRLVTCRGKTQTLFMWAEEVGMSKNTLYSRIVERKLDPEAAIFGPLDLSKRRAK